MNNQLTNRATLTREESHMYGFHFQLYELVADIDGLETTVYFVVQNNEYTSEQELRSFTSRETALRATYPRRLSALERYWS